ncbi:MAG: repeat protein, partial [Pedosphaera sp.]|nr:repeat protein [Pedosphaera sp.]
VVLRIAVLCGLGWLVFRSREPVYHGKTLSHWLGIYTSPPRNAFARREAEDAVRHIGTNAIPTLLRMLRAKDSGFTASLIRSLSRQQLLKIRFTGALERNMQAMNAFATLGATAKEAVPELIRIHDQNISWDSRWATVFALGGIGPAAKEAIPLLLHGMPNADQSIRFATVRALGQIHAEPALVVPVLTDRLQDGDPEVRVVAASALGQFGADARPAIPTLRAWLTDKDSRMREAVTSALQQIDPEAAAKGGIQ